MSSEENAAARVGPRRQQADESAEDTGRVTDTTQPAAADLLGSRRQLLDGFPRDGEAGERTLSLRVREMPG